MFPEANPIPKTINQEINTPAGTSTENGHFFEDAQQFKDGLRPAEVVRVYEKIRSGIWAFAGTFELLDAWPDQSSGRSEFKFKL